MRSGKFLRNALVLLLCLILLFPAGWGLSSDGGGGSYYFTYEQLGEEVQTLAAQYPDLVDVSVLGNSVEGRNIWSVTVGKGAKKVLITGVLHASEWINAPVLLKIIEYYAQGYYQGGRVQGQPLQYFLDNYSLTFLPMVNPDGVTLVQEGADAFPDREGELRAMNPRGLDFSRWKANIRGVDLNRNYDVHWGEPVTETVATEPSYAYYPGPAPESEPETRVVADWVRENQPVLFLDYHSYDEIIFWYYLQTGARLTRDRNIAKVLADHAGYKLEAVNTKVLPSPTSTYWASDVLGIPSICVEGGDRPPYLLTTEDVPEIFSRVKDLPLVAIKNMPGYKPYIPVQAVSLPPSLAVALGGTEILPVSVLPGNASNKQLTWTSNNPQVAAVDAQGKVTGLAPGRAIITATALDGGWTAHCEVTVYRALPRLKGANRYSTAVEVSKAGWQAAETVVLARGDDFADALAGGPLAHQLEAPLLLTKSGTLPGSTRDEIQRLGAKTVYLLGGTSAIGKGVEAALREMGLDTVRISGKNRFETAVAIARRLEPSAAAVLAYGLDFPDALAAASHAAARGYPILLTTRKDLPQATAEIMQELDITNTLVVGGDAVISESVVKKLPRPIRIKGANRYATAAEIARYFHQDSGKLFITSGLDYADALTGAVLAAREGKGILLTADKLPLALEDYIITAQPQQVVLLGGRAAVSLQAEIALSNLLEELKGVVPK